MMSKQSRKRSRIAAAVSALAAGAILLSGCASGNSALASTSTGSSPKTVVPITTAFAFLENVQDAGYFVADDSGYYAKQGVAVKFVAGGGSAPAPEVAIASGQAQIGVESNVSRLFNYLSKASDIVIIGQAFQRAPNGILSLKARPIKAIKELTGSRIMGPPTNQAFVDGLMKVNDVSDFKFVPGGADIGALQSGQADGMLAFATNQPVALEAKGLKPNKDFFFTSFDKLDYPQMADVIIASKSFVEEHPGAVAGFLKASTEGWDQAQKDPKAATEVTINKYATNQGLDPVTQEKSLKLQFPLMQSALTEKEGLFAVDPKAIETNIYPGLKAAGITNLPDIYKVVDMGPLKAAQK
jgi:ABC-type nitrate/sulfonate/bicarbonate transport systems, periplasmic components